MQTLRDSRPENIQTKDMLGLFLDNRKEIAIY